MKTPALLLVMLLVSGGVAAQNMGPLQYYRANDKTGINTFETPKTTDVEFDGLRVRIGGANTLQFQSLTQSGASENLHDLVPNFNLATSNLDLDVQLHNGLRMHLRVYLSSRHHPEAWVKDGYLQIDRLDFIRDGFLSWIMDRVTFKVGHMEINYGDARFRRTDNGMALHNPFVGNYIMDAFTTEVAGEVYYQHNGFLAMAGITNGKLDQGTIRVEPVPRPSLIGKLGHDRQWSPDLRVRLTGSAYVTRRASGERYCPICRGPSGGVNLYKADRAGARYYDIMEADRMSGRFDPDFSDREGGKMTAVMINPFLKYRGLEFFGVLEQATGRAGLETENRTVRQYGAELLYRIGPEENFYLGGRYNLVTGERANGDEIDISRINIGGGWFLTNNILTKIEYITQKYDGFTTGILRDAEFSGVVMEAVVSF